MVDVKGCETGSKRYDGVAARVAEAGASWSTADCFDRCEHCERGLLAKIDGTLMKFESVDALTEAIETLAAG